MSRCSSTCPGNPGVGRGYAFSSAWPLGLIRSGGMILPGKGLPVSGSLMTIAFLKNGLAGIEQLAQVAAAHRRGRHRASRRSPFAPLDPLFGPEEEQLRIFRVGHFGDENWAADIPAELVEAERRGPAN